MAAETIPTYIKPEEYLALEHLANSKSEYENGVIVAMSGASMDHNRISSNINASLHSQMRGRPCEPFGSDMRVSVKARNRYYYPDVSAACCGPEVETISGVESLTNPILIIEVLSESTANRDQIAKWTVYQSLDSLKLYVIVAQDRPEVQMYQRQEDGSWRYTRHEGLEGSLVMPEIECELKLSEIYERVQFELVEEGVTEAGANEAVVA